MRSVRAAQEAAAAAQQQQHKKQPFHKEEKKYTCRRPHRPDATVWREATARSVYQNECQCLHPLSSFLSFVMHTQPVSPFLQRTPNCLYFFYLFFTKKTSFRTINASAIFGAGRRPPNKEWYQP
jgi:hypothetical protein